MEPAVLLAAGALAACRARLSSDSRSQAAFCSAREKLEAAGRTEHYLD